MGVISGISFIANAKNRLSILITSLIHDFESPANDAEYRFIAICIWGNGTDTIYKSKKATYTTLLTSDQLNSYLSDIDKQAQERFVLLIEDMKQAQGITEQLKTENALEWVGRMNNIRVCAVEIVNEEIIYI